MSQTPPNNYLHLREYINFYSKSFHLKYFDHFTTRRVSYLDKCIQASRTAREQGKKIMFTSGCFDILHMGHVLYLHYLKNLADILIVGVDDNKNVAMFKGESRPYVDEIERAGMISTFDFVDFVFIMSQPWTHSNFFEKLNPHYVGIPSFDPNMSNKLKKAKLCGVEPIIAPLYLRGSTTSKLVQDMQTEFMKTKKIKF